MGPFSEQKQIERADSIQRLLDSNPRLDDHMKSIWLKHQRNLCLNEDEYNKRVKDIYTNSFKPNGYFDYLND
jgi:hypothetical protein